jgi:nucleolar protein 58
MLAAKAALAIRVDALGEDVNNEMGIEHRATLEKRLHSLEAGIVNKSLINKKNP